MNIIIRHFAYVAMALGLSVQCFAVQDVKMTSDESLSYDNYYVQPGSVYISPNGIFVSLEGALVQVNTICGDERGVFVPYEEMNRNFVRCTYCGGWYDPDHPENHKCKGL